MSDLGEGGRGRSTRRPPHNDSPSGEALKLLPLLLIVALVGVGPVASAGFNAFFHDIYGERSWAVLKNFRSLLSDPGFFYSLRITVAWALAGSLLTVVLGFALATVLRKRGFVSRALFASLLVPWGVPAYIAVPVWRAFLHGEGGASLLAHLTGVRINLLTDTAAAFIASLAVSTWLSVPLTAVVIAGVIILLCHKLTFSCDHGIMTPWPNLSRPQLLDSMSM